MRRLVAGLLFLGGFWLVFAPKVCADKKGCMYPPSTYVGCCHTQTGDCVDDNKCDGIQYKDPDGGVCISPKTGPWGNNFRAGEKVVRGWPEDQRLSWTMWSPGCGTNRVCVVKPGNVKVYYFEKNNTSSTFWLKTIDPKTDTLLAMGELFGFSHKTGEPAYWKYKEFDFTVECGKEYLVEHRIHWAASSWSPCEEHRGKCSAQYQGRRYFCSWGGCCGSACGPRKPDEGYCCDACCESVLIDFKERLTFRVDCPHDAACVSHTIPTLMYPTQTKNVSVVMRNTGTATSVWTSPNFTLKPVQNVWSKAFVDLTAPVYPGNQVGFNFDITAPAAGSYNGAWQMYNQSAAFGATCGPTVVVQNPSCTFRNPPTDPYPLNVFVDGQLAVCANLDIQPATSPRPPVARSHWTITDSSIARLPNDTGSATTQGSACTTVLGVKAGRTTLRVTVELAPSGTCTAQDIPITVRNRPWWRVYGGNVTAAGGNVVDPLPEPTYDYICNRSSSPNPNPPRTPPPIPN